MRQRGVYFFFFKQKTASEILAVLEFRRVLFRSGSSASDCHDRAAAKVMGSVPGCRLIKSVPLVWVAHRGAPRRGNLTATRPPSPRRRNAGRNHSSAKATFRSFGPDVCELARRNQLVSDVGAKLINVTLVNAVRNPRALGYNVCPHFRRFSSGLLTTKSTFTARPAITPSCSARKFT